MDATMQIPDDIASRWAAAGHDLARLTLETLALEEYKSGHLSKPELRKMLVLGRIELDGFLRSHKRFRTNTRLRILKPSAKP